MLGMYSRRERQKEGISGVKYFENCGLTDC
jgi:hypothetical protein